MPIDFFAEGAEDQSSIQFTKQENQFLNAKLVFLDPRKTYRIPFGNVLSLLKFSGLQPDRLNKVIHNCSIEGDKKTISYDQMKKIFRGVALAQNKIQPSKINIEANIKCKMPVFHDDSDDDQQQQKPVQKKTQSHPPHPPTNQTPIRQTQPKQQNTVQPQTQDPIAMYNQYWVTLKTKNNTIDGTQVKRICTNNNTNKANLSKSWKLCNLSQKGCLTKGQFFIFMNIINTPQIPASLTKQMKQLIAKIDKQAGYKKSSTTTTATSAQNQNQNQVNPVIKKAPEVAKDLAKSQFFDKFGQSSVFQKPKSSTTNQTSSNSNTSAQKNQQFQKEAQFIGTKIKKNQQQIVQISKNNQQTIMGLSAVQQFVSQVNEQNNVLFEQINSLKQTQLALTQRLNVVCISMRDIISKQQGVIVQLVTNMQEQNHINQNRLSFIEDYSAQIASSLSQKTQQTKVSYTQGQKSNQDKFNKIKNRISQNSNSNSHHEQERHSDPFADQDQHQHQHQKQHAAKQSPVNMKNSQPYQKKQNVIDNKVPSKTNKSQNSNNQHVNEGLDLQHLTPEQILKMKQMQLIQLVNYLTPIKQEQYPDVVKRITSMTQQQMNTLYGKLHQMYLKKQEQNKKAEGDFPNSDQFNTSQFIDQNTLKRAGQQNMGIF